MKFNEEEKGADLFRPGRLGPFRGQPGHPFIAHLEQTWTPIDFDCLNGRGSW